MPVLTLTNRADLAVLATHADALPVHDHRAGQHQPRHARPCHAGQQDSSAVVVGGGVVRQVLHVHAQPYLGRKVDHRVDPKQTVAHRFGIANVADDEPGRHVGRRRVVHVGSQRVQHPHLVAAFPQSGQDMPADKPGTAGQEDSHSQL